MLAVILTGASLIREREQGTVEHLLVMPVVPAEIMLLKILANGIVIVIATGLSLVLVVKWWLQVPIAGSILLFLSGSCFYVFTVAALGILLGTIAATLGQFGLLSVPVILVMMLLSWAMTPMESMPEDLHVSSSSFAPTPHFVVFAQDVLYRGADAPIVWPEVLATTVIGSVFWFCFAPLSPSHFQRLSLVRSEVDHRGSKTNKSLRQRGGCLSINVNPEPSCYKSSLYLSVSGTGRIDYWRPDLACHVLAGPEGAGEGRGVNTQ